MKLLLFCPHFEPDLHAATGEVMSKLVHALADRGHHVDVVTSLPWYKGHDVDQEWRGRPWRIEKTPHGKIVRCWPFPVDKNNIPARALGFAGFTGLTTMLALRLSKPDVVMGMSPPIFLGDAAWTLAKRWKVPFVFNVQDIFPDVAVDLGALTNERVIAGAQRYERSMYRRADAVTVLSRDQAENVRAKLAAAESDPEKVHIIHNFADTDRVSVVDRNTDYRARHDLGQKTVVMYSGNVGLSQSFDLVEHAARHFADRPDVHFVINGEGAARGEVDAFAAELPNVTTADFVSREQISDALGTADLHLILLKAGLAQSSTPSKLYGILAAGRPVLASIDEGSEVSLTLDEGRCGRSVPPDDPSAFIAVLSEMLDDPVELAAMGGRAKTFVDQCLTPAAQAERFETLFSQLITERSSKES